MPELEFLANMNISPLTVEALRREGLSIIRVSEVLDRKSKDTEILDYARIHNKVIITQDLDFSALLAIGGYAKPSVVNVRLENATPEFVTKRIKEALPKIEEELKRGAVVSIDEVSARYQNLPITL